MLVLQLKPTEEVTLYDQRTNTELGRIKNIKPLRPDGRAHLGFELPSHIRILRNELLGGKDSPNGKDQ